MFDDKVDLGFRHMHCTGFAKLHSLDVERVTGIHQTSGNEAVAGNEAVSAAPGSCCKYKANGTCQIGIGRLVSTINW